VLLKILRFIEGWKETEAVFRGREYDQGYSPSNPGRESPEVEIRFQAFPVGQRGQIEERLSQGRRSRPKD
jgi:hypothetical protein